MSPSLSVPPGTRGLAEEANRHFIAREFAKAEAKYLEILRQDDKNVYTLANLASIQLQMDRLDEAEKHLKQALAVAPEDAFTLTVLGQLKLRQGQYDDAVNTLRHAVKSDPRSAEIQNFLGIALGEKNLRVPAETAFRRAIQLDPDYASAHNNLAALYASQDPPALDLARQHYQKALEHGQPKNVELEKMLEGKPAASPK